MNRQAATQILEKEPIRRHPPEADELPDGTAEHSPMASLQDQVGNRAAQRLAGLGGMDQRIQRAPDDPTQTGQPAQPNTPSTQPAAPDPDANEAAARAANATLPQLDPTQQTPLENDAAAQQLVLVAFGGEDGLNDAFETLSDEVKKQVDADATADVAKSQRAGQTPDADQVKTANRAQFLARMRLYFGSWAEVLDHFRAIERLSDGPVDLFLHKDAKARLERALNVLKSKGHALPTIHEGFSLRHKYRSTDDKGNPIVEHPGMMIHLMGYAFDASAKTNPKIAYNNAQSTGLERHDQDLLSVTVGPAAAHMDLGPNNLSFTEAMGKRTAGDTVAATDDTDAAAVEYFNRFEAQFNQMVQGSQAFTQSLSTAHRQALLKIRGQYFDELKAIRDERKKGNKADAKVIAAHEAQRRKLLQSLPSLMTEWVAAIDKEIKAEFGKHPGMDKMRSPTEITRDLTSKQAEMQQATRDEAQAQAIKARATAERDAANAARIRAETAQRRAPSGQPFQKAMEASQTARQHELEKIDALGDAISKEIDTRNALTVATKARDTLVTERKASDKPELRGSWAWIDRLRELRQALAAPDLSTPASLRAFERLTTGDLSELGGDASPDNPPLLRLLDIGYFNPSGAFDLAFFEEAAHSGFWVGASWNFGSVDSMHFELAEGRNSLHSPGKTT